MKHPPKGKYDTESLGKQPYGDAGEFDVSWNP
jgi:hypothetical protein